MPILRLLCLLTNTIGLVIMINVGQKLRREFALRL